MTQLTVTQAAKAAGVSRTTIYEKIESGELSRGANRKIDTTELLRCFGELKGQDQGKVPARDAKSEAAANEWIQELVDSQQQQIADLNRRLEEKDKALTEAAERAERQQETWLKQLDKVTALLPAPEDKQPEAKRGFFANLFS